jgi:hypothetical protein
VPDEDWILIPEGGLALNVDDVVLFTAGAMRFNSMTESIPFLRYTFGMQFLIGD